VLEDGSPDLAAASGWFTLGHLADSGVEDRPDWVPASPTDVTLPLDNAGAGISNLDGRPWIQIRMTFYLPPGVGTDDPGPYVDRFDLRFGYDQ
jgi:hypothetical protein